jgi:predicted Zn-dependent protease
MLNSRIAASPDRGILYVLRGEVQLAMKLPREAVESFGLASKKEPTLVAAYRGLGMAYLAAGQPQQAVDALKSGLEKTRQSPWIARDLAGVLESQGRFDEAVAVYEAMLDRNPREDVAANNLAMLLVTHRTDARSFAQAGVLVERFAGSTIPAYLDTRGWVLFKSGDYSGAMEAFGKAVSLAPGARVLWYHLGLAQLKAGQTAEARKSLEAAVADGPDYPELQDARALLKTM